REVEELARNAPSLQRVEGGKSLVVRNPEIAAAVDDQHGGLPLLDKVDRILLLVTLWVFPVRPSLLPFGEPELFGTVVHHPLVERAVVGDQAAEPVGPVAGDPVGHVPAVRGAEGADTVAVQP